MLRPLRPPPPATAPPPSFLLQVFDYLLNGDLYPYPSYFRNVTGCSNYDNMLRCTVSVCACVCVCMCVCVRACVRASTVSVWLCDTHHMHTHSTHTPHAHTVLMSVDLW